MVRPSSAGGYQGGIGLVTRERTDGWGIESMHFHGSNVVSCKIVTRNTRTPLASAYLPTLTLEHLPYFKEALQRFKGLDLIVLGYFNVYLENSQSSRSQRVADLLTEFDLIDLVCQTQQFCRFRDLKT